MRTGGEKLFLDFTGDSMGYTDHETGKIVQYQAFVATLPASDYGYLIFVLSQRTEDYVYAFTQCLKHLGGVLKMLVPDNLKAADAILDRLVHTSARFELKGSSMRQKNSQNTSVS